MQARIAVLIAAGAMLLAACGASSLENSVLEPPGDTSAASESTTTSTTDGPAAVAFPAGASALDDMFADEFPDPLVNPQDLISGGPPPDGIPPIDDPVFLPVEANLDLLPDVEPVVALELNGDARAYPIRAMVWHEIVNDSVGGVPVSVTYCPLCNSAATYERTIEGSETTFGTSGRLFASALVMYDRATESLWTHYNGEAVVGVLAGTRLVEHASPLMAWADFRDAYPTGQVLDWTQSGVDRDYGRNPYTGYDDPDNTPFLFRGALDDRAQAMQRVVGVELKGASAAYALDNLSVGDGSATNAEVGGEPVVIFWKAGQSSALDDGSISDGRDVGSVAVFDPVVDGRTLTFDRSADGFVDLETSSTWSIAGEALSGPLAGTRLTRIAHLDTFWFAWSTYQPGSDLIEG
ncbi:MAG: DUF3179 domain-containing protein [Acidimicrobiia bacterium]